MDCCCSGVETTIRTICGECGETGRAVSRQTVVHHLKGVKLHRIGTGGEDYNYCASSECPVVYYSTGDEAFTVEDVRELVTSKASGDERPLCYCFGFTEGDVRAEIARTGESSIPAQVTEFIKQKLCVCEVRNPAGACCLGEINRTVKKLSERSIHFA